MTVCSFCYSVRANSVDEATELASKALGIEFFKRDSWDRGEEYSIYKIQDKLEISIQGNWECEGGLAEEDFPEAGILMYDSSVADGVELKHVIDARKDIFELLRASR